jgi:hypothetical protein
MYLAPGALATFSSKVVTVVTNGIVLETVDDASWRAAGRVPEPRMGHAPASRTLGGDDSAPGTRARRRIGREWRTGRRHHRPPHGGDGHRVDADRTTPGCCRDGHAADRDGARVVGSDATTSVARRIADADHRRGQRRTVGSADAVGWARTHRVRETRRRTGSHASRLSAVTPSGIESSSVGSDVVAEHGVPRKSGNEQVRELQPLVR